MDIKEGQGEKQKDSQNYFCLYSHYEGADGEGTRIRMSSLEILETILKCEPGIRDRKVLKHKRLGGETYELLI